MNLLTELIELEGLIKNKLFKIIEMWHSAEATSFVDFRLEDELSL